MKTIKEIQMYKNSIWKLMNYLIIGITAVLFMVPILLIISGSITDEKSIMTHGFSLIPKEISFHSYKYVFLNIDKLLNAYKTTTLVTVVGTILSILITSLTAYPLSRNDLKYGKQLSFYVYFTMLFSGGMVPWYLVCTKIGLKDNIFALILPMVINAWNVMLLRNFFKSIPASIYESANIDGAGEWTVVFKIVLPLSLPGMATVGLFISLGYWNDWWLGLMLINKEVMNPLQLFLRRIISNVQFLTLYGSNLQSSAVSQMLPSEGIKMSTCLLTIGPIIFVYPFVQRYFVKGITVGAVKG